ncbi:MULTISPECIES: hypothetical protein [unclassified Bacillus (in: firmicutes)]|uniref:hypothetical protein n=1 Tax=unclassified Bacillus (in: firmicutes) TaxID=185979 RepID=UPI0008E88F26|nr:MULTISPECIES: hypothetical protein [unclassified Bacillus (in: firmicutes)]SFA69459.1 hypothetical protein SAMN02799634_10121 [Bacillus sp. UNCCL13]SFQ58761.1 hypothetical protein SAMN04488577_0305 [Bacillus sp. cl95]
MWNKGNLITLKEGKVNINKHNYYFIDKNTGKICGPDILDNEKLNEPHSLKQLKTLLYNEKLMIFIRKFKNVLEPIPQDEVKMKWETQFKNNISLKESDYLEDYPNEYFYFVDKWVINNGEMILVFTLVH